MVCTFELPARIEEDAEAEARDLEHVIYEKDGPIARFILKRGTTTAARSSIRSL
jgi:hypothetical protein